MLAQLKRQAGRIIDRRYGTDTCEPTSHAELGYDPAKNVYYEPSRWLSLSVAVPRRSVATNDVFADIGSGKGRVVLQAARRYPFARVIGVERSPELTACAVANLARIRRPLRCPDVEFVTADASRWNPPEDLTIAYMFNPFYGAAFEAAIQRLIDTVDRRHIGMRLVYVNPREHQLLMATGRIAEQPPPPAILLRIAGLGHMSVRRYEILP